MDTVDALKEKTYRKLVFSCFTAIITLLIYIVLQLSGGEVSTMTKRTIMEAKTINDEVRKFMELL